MKSLSILSIALMFALLSGCVLVPVGPGPGQGYAPAYAVVPAPVVVAPAVGFWPYFRGYYGRGYYRGW
jgi:hypothetical protein